MGCLLLGYIAHSFASRLLAVAWSTAGARDKSGELIPMSVKVGDTVLLPEYGGQNVTLDGVEMSLFREDDILGIMEQ